MIGPHEQALICILVLMTLSCAIWAGWCILDDYKYTGDDDE